MGLTLSTDSAALSIARLANARIFAQLGM